MSWEVEMLHSMLSNSLILRLQWEKKWTDLSKKSRTLRWITQPWRSWRRIEALKCTNSPMRTNRWRNSWGSERTRLRDSNSRIRDCKMISWFSNSHSMCMCPWPSRFRLVIDLTIMLLTSASRMHRRWLVYYRMLRDREVSITRKQLKIRMLKIYSLNNWSVRSINLNLPRVKVNCKTRW